MLVLKKPSYDLREAILDYKQEFFEQGETNINGSCSLAHYDNFDEWLQFVTSIETLELRDGVHASTFFSVRQTDNKIIGSIQLRHSLTSELWQHGGNIGYGIRPLERGKGFGKEQLYLVVDMARQMNIQELLITCDKANIVSCRTALSCGAVLLDENIYEGTPQLRYIINLEN